MTPNQLRIQELEKQVKILTDFMTSFNNPGQMNPQHVRTIRTVVGALNITLDSLTDVSVPSPSNGQVLKYNGTIWVAGTDNT